MSILIYGCDTIAGQKTAIHAIENRALPCVLGGEDSSVLSAFSKKLAHSNAKDRPFSNSCSVPYVTLGLCDAEADAVVAVNDSLKKADSHDVKVLLNCITGCEYSAKVLMKACISSGVHYVSLGSISSAEFDVGKKLNKLAYEKKVLLLPNAGFYGSLADYIAAMLRHSMPSATALQIGYDFQDSNLQKTKKRSVRSHSHFDILMNIIQGLRNARRSGFAGIVRKQSLLRRVRFGKHFETFSIEFSTTSTAGKTKHLENYHCIRIPSVDVIAIVEGTGLSTPSIEVFCAESCDKNTTNNDFNWCILRWFIAQPIFAFFLLQMPMFIYSFFCHSIAHVYSRTLKVLQDEIFVALSNSDENYLVNNGTALVWGKAIDKKNDREAYIVIKTCPPLSFSIIAAIGAAENLLYNLPRRYQGSGARQGSRRGLSTPSTIFGADHLLRVAGLGPCEELESCTLWNTTKGARAKVIKQSFDKVDNNPL